MKHLLCVFIKAMDAYVYILAQKVTHNGVDNVKMLNYYCNTEIRTEMHHLKRFFPKMTCFFLILFAIKLNLA